LAVAVHGFYNQAQEIVAALAVQGAVAQYYAYQAQLQALLALLVLLVKVTQAVLHLAYCLLITQVLAVAVAVHQLLAEMEHRLH
jgi:hypothetical protein